MAGKPRKAGARLSSVIACRLTVSEDAAYKSQVEASGLSSGEYLRKLIVERPVQIIARPKPSVDKARLVYLFNKASNNLNQIAKRINSAHSAGLATAKTYDQVMGELVSLGAYLRGQIDRVD